MASAPAVSQIDRIKNRALGIRTTIGDSRAAQTPSKAFVPPTTAQVEAAKKSFGVDGALYNAARKEILVHICFDQRRGDSKPRRCNCDNRIAYVTARNLIDHGLADFLRYKRRGEELENRKSIVVTAAFLHLQAKSQDALNHKLPLSISAFSEYHMASIADETTSGLDKSVQSVRLGTIAEHKKEVEDRRKHKVGPANFRKGAGGLTVGYRGKVVDLTAAGVMVKKGYTADSDSNRDDVAAGNITGQLNSKPDPIYAHGLGADDMYARHPAVKGSKSEALEKERNLPKAYDEKIGKEESAAFKKESIKKQTTIQTGIEE
jgi:hypothetical protein